ncbi:MAG: lipocalin-like domain-containing protein [Lachnospiraceae bacterium]|nr:lipocalin-like domain-containing protein [Candidatus Colinaster scatohippi]
MKKEDLIGTWKLVSYTLITEEGSVIYPLGKDCKAYLIYTEDGHVSAQMSAVGRKPYASGDLHEGTLAEMAEAAHTYMAYCGTYTLMLEDSKVMHNIEISMNPCWENQSQERILDYDGKFLSISADINNARLIWEKTS